MKKFSIIIILVALVITACGSSISTETRPASESAPSDQGRPTPTSENRLAEPTAMPVPYPGFAQTATPYPEDYPAPQEFPTIDPYPAEANTVWVLFPVGIQCEDVSTSKYQGELGAEAGLTAAGITVHDVTTTELMVCTACNCPTSAHYRAEINETDLDNAVSLGWEPE